MTLRAMLLPTGRLARVLVVVVGWGGASALLAFAEQYLADFATVDEDAGDSKDTIVAVPLLGQGVGVHCGGEESASSLLALGWEYLANAVSGGDEAVGGNSGAAEGRRQVRNFRRGLCVQERDGLVALEVARAKLQEQLGRQAFLEQKAAAAGVLDQRHATQQLAEQKAMSKKREKARQELWSKAFGEESFFHPSAAAGFSASDVVPKVGFEFVMAGGWASWVSGGFLDAAVGGLCSGRPRASSLIEIC